MNENDELKFTPIRNGMILNQKTKEMLDYEKRKIIENSNKVSGCKIVNVDVSKRNDEKVKNKAKKAFIAMGTALLIYLILGGVISTEIVNHEYDVKSYASGSSLVTDTSNVPDNAYLDKFTDVITNPVEFIDSAKEVMENNRSK